MELVLAADSPGFEVNRLPRWLSGKGSGCDAGGTGLMPGSGRSPGGGSGSPLQCSCWKIPRTEEPGGLQSVGSQRVRHS